MVRSRSLLAFCLALAPLTATAWDADLLLAAEARHFYHQDDDGTS